MIRRVVLPLQEWRELGVRGRREVRRATRRGHRHPDPYVADLARAWARETLRIHGRPSSVRERAGGGVLGVGVLAVFGSLFGPEGVGASLGGAGAERRLARRILAVSTGNGGS
ncbi:hypothetical protein [Blastococcus sp. CT_GayMR16]|uniref:hypothetical protein n=1 Tax=Blastococcus sp. CT_GayMR16 TaxID=2559607 RepID=UPI00107446B3|nr:hypothetical protein [Blastococcus sp. CT_GayMR16]TFV91285.1 hypothetical protein E4P38_01425 [Blastococcus sp. CT_GayMR16]